MINELVNVNNLETLHFSPLTTTVSSSQNTAAAQDAVGTLGKWRPPGGADTALTSLVLSPINTTSVPRWRVVGCLYSGHTWKGSLLCQPLQGYRRDPGCGTLPCPHSLCQRYHLVWKHPSPFQAQNVCSTVVHCFYLWPGGTFAAVNIRLWGRSWGF